MIKRFAILFGALSLSLPLWADITVTPGVGKTVHTDTVNGLEYQVIKIIDGTTGGTSSMTVTAAGAAKVDGSASTQPVTLNQFNAVPVVSTYTTVVSTGLPVTGTFFQVTQPVSIGQANAVPVVSTYTTVVSTGLPVTGTFFQTTQPVSIGQANAVPVVSTYTTVVSTGLPVTGTFFQASQPVTVSQSNAIPVTSTYTTVVSTGLPVTGTFFQATQPISATIGVPVTSTYTTVVSTGIPMAGASFNGDTGLNVHLVNGGSGGTSASIPSAFPATVTPVAGINPSGNLATFAVDSSSSINVHITAGGGTGGTASSIPGAFPATVTPVAGINPSGNMATFAVDSSSGLKLSGQFAIPVTSTYTTVVSTGLPVAGASSNNGAAAATNRIGTLPAIAQSAYGNNGSAYTQGRDAALSIFTKSGFLATSQYPDISVNSYSVSIESPTYSGTTDLACIVGNNITTTIVPYITVTGTQTTAGIIDVEIVKRSAIDAGAFSTMTVIGLDSSYAVNSSSVIVFGAAPTVGAGVIIDSKQIAFLAPATASANDVYVSPSSWRMTAPVLRGPSQMLCVNFGGQTVTGGIPNITIHWLEATTP